MTEDCRERAADIRGWGGRRSRGCGVVGEATKDTSVVELVIGF